VSEPEAPLTAGAVSSDVRWMTAALLVAEEAAVAGEVPVAAVIVAAGVRDGDTSDPHRGGSLLASSGNCSRREGDATAHAELVVLRAAAAALGGPVLDGCTLYVTLEPCAMCAGAIVLARVGRVVFGAWDDKAGMGGSVGDLLRHPRLNHRPEVRGGVLADECGALLSRFFAARRAARAELPLEAL